MSTWVPSEAARYYTETSPAAVRQRTSTGFPDLGFADKEALGWQDRALCAEVDPEIFFPERGASLLDAKRVCRGCEVRAECLEYAVTNGIAFGIWGGLSERQRRHLGPQHLDLPANRETGKPVAA